MSLNQKLKESYPDSKMIIFLYSGLVLFDFVEKSQLKTKKFIFYDILLEPRKLLKSNSKSRIQLFPLGLYFRKI